MNVSTFDQASGVLVCLFEVASRTFAVEISHAREAHVFNDYTVVPLAPPHLIGMTNLRGAIIPIVDLRLLLGLSTGAGTVHALVVEANAIRVALAVDRVLGVEALEEEVEAGDADAAHSDLERRRLRRGDDVVPVLDVVKIVDSLVRRAPSETGDAPAVAKEGEA